MEPISHNVRYFRKLRGMTQAELAKAAGTTQYTVSEIELAHREPHPATLRKLASALGVRVADFYGEAEVPKVSPSPPQERLFNNGGLEDAAQSEALQEALAVLFQSLARRGQGIVEQSLREGPSEALSQELNEYYSEVAALHRLKGRRDIFGRDSDELAEAEAAYQEVEARIQAMLRQDVDATEEERDVARKFRDNTKSYEIEEPKADAS